MAGVAALIETAPYMHLKFVLEGRIPKEFRFEARGCEERATLGTPVPVSSTLKGLRLAAGSECCRSRHNPFRVGGRYQRRPRVARKLATLGWRTQSLRD